MKHSQIYAGISLFVSIFLAGCSRRPNSNPEVETAVMTGDVMTGSVTSGDVNTGAVSTGNGIKNDLILFDPSNGTSPIFSYMGITLPKGALKSEKRAGTAGDLEDYKKSKNFEFELTLLSDDSERKFFGNLVGVSNPIEKEKLLEDFGGLGYVILSAQEYEDYKKTCETLVNKSLCGIKQLESTLIIYGLDIVNNFEATPSIKSFVYIIKPSNEIVFLKDGGYRPIVIQEMIRSAYEKDSTCESMQSQCFKNLYQKIETAIKKELANPSQEIQSRFVEIEQIASMILIK